MTKYFVLRPHALLSSQDSLQKFGEDNVVVVPLAVIDEVQNMKGLMPEKAKVRGLILKYLRKASQNGALTDKGFVQENGSILKIEVNKRDEVVDVPNITEFQKCTLQVCLGLQKELEAECEEGKNVKEESHKQVILITNNTALQIKAYTLGINAEPFKDEIFPELAQQYKGKMEINVSSDIVNTIRSEKRVNISAIYNYQDYEWIENCIVILKAANASPVYSKVEGDVLVYQDAYAREMYGVRPMTEGQRIYMCALASDCPLVVVKGTAGTGKTLLALANSLECFDKGEFTRINISSPVYNENLGYLPGDINDKVSPFLSGVMHNLEFLINNKMAERNGSSNKGSGDKTSAKSKGALPFMDDRPNHNWEKPQKEDGSIFFCNRTIRILAISTLRGASIMDQVFIVDEAQNIEPKVMKTILTRMGKGSKLIICGDATQVDHPGLDERYNGLVYVAEKMKGSPTTMVVTFEEDETVRGDLAEEAARRL